MTFSLAVCDDNGKQVSGVYNAKAFDCLVCDLDIWYECSAEISGYLHEKYNELLLSDWHNVKLLNKIEMSKIFTLPMHIKNYSNTVMPYKKTENFPLPTEPIVKFFNIQIFNFFGYLEKSTNKLLMAFFELSVVKLVSLQNFRRLLNDE
ncbi:hypothetical protein BpHYR1_039835 [Brachionus plicatilis]|uniref:Uncharacterized protein n=1 Tax=Brachionus plicatilis TaxID=10195 RepID=A0A3M7S945_BRAPC|nr:hypothetical protein BpHYR1_039835 [Brachionus plicatilis]